jgi:hypothetical protein
MTATDLVAHRLRNQKLARTTFRRPEEVVAWLGAVQSQDYIGAKWGVGVRAKGLTDAAIERAFDEGRILRTHVLRPTWHFVAPADIRWLLALTAPRVHQFNAYHYRQRELTPKLFARSHAIIEKALDGGKHLTRKELETALKQARIATEDLRLGTITMHAELSAVICSGPMRGKQHTYALLEERVPRVAALSREEALVTLTRRYFASHGPATVRDYAWWSGLSMRDAKAGIEMIASESASASASASGSASASAPKLERREIEECTYWFYPSRGAGARAAVEGPEARLLPNFDEYFIAYKDQRAVLNGGLTLPLLRPVRPEFAHLLTIDGWLAGIWKRTVNGRTADVEVRPFRPLKKPERSALDAAVERYRTFMDRPAKLTVS